MIKFFRHIRKSMIKDNRTSKYLLYAIGEIILVVIGILIALQINNWNENKKQQAITQIYYEQLLKDLDKDKIYLSEKLATYNKRITLYNNYLDSYKTPNLSPDVILANQFKLSFKTDNIMFQNSTLESLENTGDIKLIPVDLRNMLTDLKQNQELIIQFTIANYNYYMNSINSAGLTGSLPGFEARLSNQPQLKELLKIEDKKDKTILSIEYASYLKNYSEKTMVTQFKTTLKIIENAMTYIKEQIDKK